jgi:hypothetical protein
MRAIFAAEFKNRRDGFEIRHRDGGPSLGRVSDHRIRVLVAATRFARNDDSTSAERVFSTEITIDEFTRSEQPCIRFFTGQRAQRCCHQGHDQDRSNHSQAQRAIFRQD